jgi:hypothetical protein
MKTTIKIEITDGNIIDLSWSNNLEFISYYLKQRPLPFINVQPNLDYSLEIERWVNIFWKDYRDYFSLYNNLGNNAKILDIGCGNSITDLLASKYNNTAQFYLLDKAAWDTNYIWYDTKHIFYHSWNVVNDLIVSSSLNKEKFNFLNYTDDWPTDLDLITSFFSWGFHYPIENEFGYWEKVLKNLKIGGKLYLDISNNALDVNPHSIDMISDVLDSNPIVRKHAPSRKEKNYILKDNNFGQGCLWTRNK